MKPQDLKQEGKPPKREQSDGAKQGPHRAEIHKPGPYKLSHVALGKRRSSRAPSTPVRATGQNERPRSREIAETPQLAFSRRRADSPNIAIAERLPVRSTKIVPSIEAREQSSTSFLESEASSGSEYDDEQWRRHLAQRGPVRKTTTKGAAPKPYSTVSTAESTTRAPAPKPAKTGKAAERTMTAQASRDTATVKASKPAAVVPVPKPTITVPALRTTSTALASNSEIPPTVPQPTTSQSTPQLAPSCQARKRPVKLKEDPVAWFAKRAGKTKLSKRDQRELDNHHRRQRQGTANFHRPDPELARKAIIASGQKIVQSRGTPQDSVSTAQPRPSSIMKEKSPYLDPNLKEPPTEDVSICCSIERDQAPNFVDQLTERVSHVVDLEYVRPEHTARVKSESCEESESAVSTAEHEIIPDRSMLETVTKEVAALRSELQYFKGQVSAYRRTLEVDGVQLQHRFDFDAGVKQNQEPKGPELHEEVSDGASRSVPSEPERQQLERWGSADRTEVPQGELVPSSRLDETKSGDQQGNERGEPSVSGRESSKRTRTVPGHSPQTLGRDDDGMINNTEERPSKRPKKREPAKKEKERQAQGDIVVPLKASEAEPDDMCQAATDQSQKLNPEEERLVQLITGRLSTATSPPIPTDLHAKALPAHDADTSAQPLKEELAAAQGSATTTGALPIITGPEASRPVRRVVINNPFTSPGASRRRASHGVPRTPVAPVSASGGNHAPGSGPSGSGPSIWSAGVNSIPLGSRRQRREPPRGQTIDDRWNRPWQLPYDRREVFIRDTLPRCICSLLHPYFESGLNRRPNLEAFPGTRKEFFTNIEQMVNCHGHDKEMTLFCEGLWACEKANRKVSPYRGIGNPSVYY